MTTPMSRRAALGLLGAGGAAVVLAGCGSGMGRGSTTPTNPDVGGTRGQPFADPSVLRSTNGLLEVTLAAAATRLPWGTGTRYALAYNGSVPGPTLRVRPGDTLRVHLRNELDEPTNLHTHGLHVSPEGNSDNIYVAVEPGATFTYEYRIPADHPSGTFWYHPHHHGFVAAQLFGGLAGALVVDDAIDDLPELQAADEHLLLLSDPRIGTSSSVLDATGADRRSGREGDVVLVNGQRSPRLAAVAGSVQHWRIVNTSPSRYYRLQVDAPTMYLIATEQGRLAAPRDVTDVTLTPGQRVEVLVPLPTPGTVTLSTTEVERGRTMGMGGGLGGGMGGGMGGMGGGGNGSSTGASVGAPTTVLTVDVSASTSAPATLPSVVRASVPAVPTQATRERSISFGAMSMGNGEFVIDGEPFSADRVLAAPKLGTTEDWVVSNNSMMDHPFHLHVWPFVVVGRSGGAPADVGWHDTVNIPAGQSVTIRIPFEDFAGKTVCHCHILDHEDLGMMANVDVR